MDTLLTKYWFQSAKGLGVGVTAYNINDAKSIIKAKLLVMYYEPNFDSYIENIDIRKLDQNHIIPNMDICSNRGVWYPNIG